jgi:anionic cell wall polymer biosynthesis LytR-Cps2A-Psr (LCP) family protein
MVLDKYKRLFTKVKRRLLSRHLIFTRLMVMSFVVFVLLVVFAGVRIFLTGSNIGEYTKMAGNFLFLPDGVVKKQAGRTNILLLGKAGRDPELTDTMMLVSVGRGEDTVLLSIPRDIWVAELSDKINSAYWQGNKKDPDGGLVLAKSVVEEIVGVPIHYAVAFDFEVFLEVIDTIGGVEVEVERSFTDRMFPIPGRENDECEGDPEYSCRYETISFEKGLQLMDGGTALKFARSRHSEDPEEGNDLARAARQQKVIIAIKDRLVSSGVLFSPTNLSRLWSAVWVSLETNLTGEQLAYIARLAFDARDKVASYTIPKEFLFNPPYSEEYDNLYVFISASGDWSRVHSWVFSVLAGD